MSQQLKQQKKGDEGGSGTEQFLNNQQFAYLFAANDNNDNTDNNNNNNNSGKITISVTPTLLTPTSPFNAGNNSEKNGYYKRRISSVQVSTTKTQNEQLNAIKKEVEYFESEVAHFKDLYNESKQQWSSSKRDKADTSAFILIQALTQWIHQYGNVAVKQYDEFKESAEGEILAMAKNMEHLTLENKRLTLLIQDGEQEKDEMNQQIQENERLIIKYKKEEKERNEDRKTEEIQKNTMKDLENELIEIKRENKILIEKYERVENYWKMTQAENDELRNKNYGIEEEVEKLRETLRANDTNMNDMKLRHQNTLKTLQLEHQNYAEQMQNEQEKLIAAQHEANQTASQMTSTAAGYIIDVDDTDIGGSGIIDDNDDFADMGGVVSLENEINVYEYEDDDWLDETDSDFDDEQQEETPEPEELPEPEEPTQEAQEYNRQNEWETEKTSYYQDMAPRDIGFSYSKIQFGQEQQMEEKEPLEFERETMKIEVKKKKKMGLMMSTTGFSCTPQMASPMTKYGAFASETTGTMGQKNELIHKNNALKPLKKVIYIDRGPKKQSPMMSGGKNFAERLAMFKHLEETKGGKPQIMEYNKGIAMIKKWQNKNADNNKFAANPLNQISKSDKNIHVTKSTVHTVNDSKNRAKQINVLKITKTKAHILTPRLVGYMTIIRSSFIPKWKVTQKPRYFFVLDGLPSQTNVNEKEPDFAKNRQHDFLVPSLFFFQDKNDYDTFASQVSNVPTRDIKFQKLFAKYAKGIFPLNEYAMECTVLSCTKRINALKKRDNIKLPISEINETGIVNDLTILLCNDQEIHRFCCNDKFSRNKWVKKVNKLVDKRVKRLIDINNGLLDVNTQNDMEYSNTNTRTSVIGTPDSSIPIIQHQ